MTLGQSRRAEKRLARQVLRALQGLKQDVTVGQLTDPFIGRRVDVALDRRLALAKGTVRKAFEAGYAEGAREVNA